MEVTVQIKEQTSITYRRTWALSTRAAAEPSASTGASPNGMNCCSAAHPDRVCRHLEMENREEFSR